MKAFKNKAKIILYNIFIVFIILEISLHTELGSYLKLDRNYLDNFNTNIIPTNYNIDKFTKIKKENKEFITEYTTNNEGFRDENFDLIKHNFRIITIGDSFTECVGSTNDSTWQIQLKEKINISLNKKVEIYNCGIASSDPVAEYFLLKDKLIKYNPDLIIMTINDSDIPEIEIRGGFNRFDHKNNLIIKKKPFWSFLLYSKVFRLLNLTICDFALNPLWKQKEEVEKANSIIQNSIDSVNQLCLINKAKFLILFQPIQWEIDNGLPYKFNSTIEYCEKNNLEYLDVREEFKKLNVRVGNKKSRFEGIFSYLYKKQDMNKDQILGSEIYWEYDYHFNNYGYSLFAKAIYPKVVNQIIK